MASKKKKSSTSEASTNKKVVAPKEKTWRVSINEDSYYNKRAAGKIYLANHINQNDALMRAVSQYQEDYPKAPISMIDVEEWEDNIKFLQ